MSHAGDPDVIEIHHIEGGRSFRVAWLCEELGLRYKLIFEAGNMQASMRRMRADYPLMPMCPVVRYKGQFMVESGAVLEVITMRHGPHLMPTIDSPDYLRHAQWMHFAEASLMSRMITQRMLAMTTGVDVDKMPSYSHGDDPDKIAMIGPRGMFVFMEDYLGRSPFFGGSAFSSADIMMYYSIRASRRVAWINLADFPCLKRWRRLVETRPAYARAMAVCSPNGADEDGAPPGLQHPFTGPPESRN